MIYALFVAQRIAHLEITSIYLARPKDMRARGTTFYCIFEKIELNYVWELGRSTLAPRHMTVKPANQSQVCSLRETGWIYLRRKSLLGVSRRSLRREMTRRVLYQLKTGCKAALARLGLPACLTLTFLGGTIFNNRNVYIYINQVTVSGEK